MRRFFLDHLVRGFRFTEDVDDFGAADGVTLVTELLQEPGSPENFHKDWGVVKAEKALSGLMDKWPQVLPVVYPLDALMSDQRFAS